MLGELLSLGGLGLGPRKAGFITRWMSFPVGCEYRHRDYIHTGFAGGLGFVGFRKLNQLCRCQGSIPCNQSNTLTIGAGDTPVELLSKVIVTLPFVIAVSTYLMLVQNRLLVELAAEQVFYYRKLSFRQSLCVGHLFLRTCK